MTERRSRRAHSSSSVGRLATSRNWLSR
jgi:hypothetical protein